MIISTNLLKGVLRFNIENNFVAHKNDDAQKCSTRAKKKTPRRPVGYGVYFLTSYSNLEIDAISSVTGWELVDRDVDESREA